MKRKIVYLLIAAALCMSACDSDEPIGNEAVFVKYYIGEYSAGNYRLYACENKQSDFISEIKLGLEEAILYQLPERFNALNPEKFLRIAERNGDTEFNDFVWGVSFSSRRVFADNYSSVHLTSDRDWDARHPAGTYLDDIVSWVAYTYSEFIRSGYVKGKGSLEDGEYRYEVKLSEIQAKQAEMISDEMGFCHSPRIRFLSAPADEGPHTLTLTITTTEGKTYRPTITLRPEAYMP